MQRLNLTNKPSPAILSGSTYKIRFVYIFLLILLSCSQIFCRFSPLVLLPSPTPTPPPPSSTPTPTLTLLPTFTPTFIPTFTPTLTPTTLLLVSSGTPIPSTLPLLDDQNAQLISAITEYQTPPLVDFKWHPTRNGLAVATLNGIQLIDPYQPQNDLIVSVDEGLSTFDFSPDGQWLLTGHRYGDTVESFYGNVQIWRAPNYPRVAFFGDYRAVSQIQYTTDGKKVAIAYSNVDDAENAVQFREPLSWEIITNIKTGNLVTMDISGDGKTLITIPDRYSIKVWDLDKEEIRYSLPTSFSGAANSVAISPDNSMFATGHYDGMIILWDLEKGERLQSMRGEGVIESLAFNPSGQILATGSGYHSTLIQIWSVATGEKLRDLEGHSRGVNFLSFATNGQYLASASYDGTIRLWGIRP